MNFRGNIDEEAKKISREIDLKIQTLIFYHFNIVAINEVGMITKEFLDIAPMLEINKKEFVQDFQDIKNGIITISYDLGFTKESIEDVKNYLSNKS
ncbi:hypothetical protein [Carnobacterium sp. ISL-102]|uniref:hypothetical protein n=1 Tax=Carnobacterium sp. ISL-102 TaxID=2819142 RepID=UPI001BE766A2|nr:hypothetical protein [Carnobacterium sp. ISL-102]MBT2732108.1 hypothetical protein [Carnobacterium sp. ISL-102]